ncbi:MAG TPA: MarR family transcriptional regulator [archaeon]|nr:MarR family transcriptional regulator [archaeon]
MKLVSTQITGIILIISAIAMLFVIFSFNDSKLQLNSFLHQDCNLPENVCPFTKSIPDETAVAYALDSIIAICGIYLLFKKQKYDEKKVEKDKKKEEFVKKLEPDDKKIYEMISSSGGIFQSELVEKTGFGKAKITRILDRLESKGLAERRRRGMTNIVVAKN